MKIVQTADLHIGLAFRDKSLEVRKKLTDDRLEALKKIVREANEQNAHFLVLAGDTFDSVHVGLRDCINPTVDVLGEFSGVAALVIPGNHDFYEAGKNTLWERFTERANNFSNIRVLHDFSVWEEEADGTKVHFYPSCCLSKHSDTHAIGWISEQPKDSNALNIGIAHGNVEGLALDKEGRYFNMSKQDLAKAGVDFFLLGHVHVPYPNNPNPVVQTNPGFFMPGTSAKFKMGSTGKGTYWVIETEGKKFRSAELKVASEIQYFDWPSREVNSTADVDNLIREIEGKASENHLLRLHVLGRLTEAEITDCRARLGSLKDRFLEFQLQDSLQLNIDANLIGQVFKPNSIEYKVLSALAVDPNDNLSLQLAFDLIKP
jgi:DNA repair protein SbcD/Mre11